MKATSLDVKIAERELLSLRGEKVSNLDLIERLIEARLNIIKCRKAMNESFDATQSVLVNLERDIISGEVRFLERETTKGKKKTTRKKRT